MKIINRKFVFIFSFLFLPVLAQAATLNFSPTSHVFQTGDDFTINLVANSPDQALNAVSGVVQFSTDELAVTSLSTQGSVVGWWVGEPTFSNETGRVKFEGVTLNPGFIGEAGQVLAINFHAKRDGVAKLNLLDPTILANDGVGTNILQTAAVGAPVANNQDTDTALISSITHPDQNRWYRANVARFKFNFPTGTDATKLLVNQTPDSEPTVVYDQAIREKQVSDLADGTWYLHVQFRTRAGWSEVSHFRLQIDTQAPDNFDLQEVSRGDLNDQRLQLQLVASDSGSGIDRYEVKIDGIMLSVLTDNALKDNGNNYYLLPALETGEHTVEVRAVDYAGNSIRKTLAIMIPPSAYSLWGIKIVSALSLGVPMLALVILLGLMLERSHERFWAWRRRVRRGVNKAEESITDAFDKLREDLEKQLSLLEKAKTKRELTKEEAKLTTALRKHLRATEKFIKREVGGIEEGMR